MGSWLIVKAFVHQQFSPPENCQKKILEKNCIDTTVASHTAPLAPTPLFTGETQTPVGPVGFEPTTKKL